MQRFLLCAALAAASCAAAAQGMEPGEWEFTSTMSSPMFPQPQTSTIRQCVTKQQAEDPSRLGPQQQGSDCKVTPGARSGSSYSWSVACPKEGVTGTGTSRWSAGSVETDMNMTVAQEGQKIQMRTQMKGRRIGPCR